MSIVKAQQFVSRGPDASAIPVVLFVGKDQYWRDRCRGKVVSAWVSTPDDPGSVHRLSLRDTTFGAVLADVRTVPMLCPRQVVIVQGVDVLEKTGERERDDAQALLQNYLQDPSTFSFLVLEADACDQRTKFFRLLRDNALVVELEGQDGSGVATVVEMARAVGCEIDDEAAELLVTLCGDDWGRAEKEISKLGTYVGERKKIAREDVRSLVVASESGSAWDLADALVAGQVKQSLEVVDRLLLSGENGSKLVGALAWTYRKLIEARDLPQSIPSFQAAQRLGMRPDRAASFVRKAHTFDRRRAPAGLVFLAEADSLLKSSGSAARTVMEFLVVRLCQWGTGTRVSVGEPR
ncbi:MAG: DNA polymerase III subunit delta [Candidatus Acidiferrum sp.]